MALRVRSSETTTITIDGEPVTLHIRRMTQTEWTAWLSRFQAFGREDERRQIALDRKRRELIEAITPAEIELRKAQFRRWRLAAAAQTAARASEERGVPVEPALIDDPTDDEARVSLAPTDSRVLTAFEADLTWEQLEARRAEDLTFAQLADAFTTESIAKYVTVDADCILDEDTNSWVTSGEAFTAKFASRTDILATAMSEIYLQHSLSDDDKKKLSSQRASQRFSLALATARGKTPAATVDDVGSEATAPIVDAMA
jgi:hypothetical protein